jgi:tetratricopeptide (TPR) repeat protein
MRRLFLVALFFLYTTPFSEVKNPDFPAGLSNEEKYKCCFKKADSLLGKFEFAESIRNCEAALQYRPNDFLMRAMICLDNFELAEKLDIKKDGNKRKKIDLYEKMIAVAEAGIRVAPDKGECYFMRGLANARKATTKGILSQLFTAKQIETDWLTAVNRKSDYTTPNGENLQASCCVALGVYYRLCPRFFLIRWLFGINGDYDKAVDYCKKAYDLDPTRIEIVKELGVALITRGLDTKNKSDIESGEKYLLLVPTLPHCLQTDEIDVQHSKMLLKDISLCPGYSRDEEQDVSEESFRKTKENK